MRLRNDCDQIICRVIVAVQPDAVVRHALEGDPFQGGRVVLVAVGKAAWPMARATCDCAGRRLDGGIIITKHGRAQGPIGSLLIREAGHSVPDQDTLSVTKEALALTDDLTVEGTILFLLSDGDSVLFEAPLVPQEKPQSITQSLLANGAGIVEINTIRKRLSTVRGRRSAQYRAPAKVFSIILSGIIGDPLGTIAPGLTYPDSSTYADTRRIAEQYGLHLSPEAPQCLEREMPRVLDNVETLITGSVRGLCAAASAACRELGCESVLLTGSLDCEAREAGIFLVAVAYIHQDTERFLASLAERETVMHLIGSGPGGRNQEPALPAVAGIAGPKDTVVSSLGGNSINDPIDAADGLVDGGTKEQLARRGVRILEVPKSNDVYHALATCGDLLHTGATGTNIDDVAVLPIRR